MRDILFSHENLIILKDNSYFIAASKVSKALKNIFATGSGTVDHGDNVTIYNNDPVFCKHGEFAMDDPDLT